LLARQRERNVRGGDPSGRNVNFSPRSSWRNCWRGRANATFEAAIRRAVTWTSVRVRR